MSVTFNRRTFGLSTAATVLLPFAARANRVVAPSPRSDPGGILGEGPMYDIRDNTLYWVDIRAKLLHATSLSGAPFRTWDMPDMIGWIVPRAKGGFVVGVMHVVYALTLDPFKLTPLLTIEADKPGNRLNDAKVDAKGRLWTGTMDLNFKERTAALYRIDPDLSLHSLDTGYVCTNGPTFSVDGTRMFHNETHDGIVYVYDVAADGGLSGKRVFAQFALGEGLPDGCTTDADDGVWIAHNGGGLISRYRPDGVRDFSVVIPAPQVTSLTFGGAGFDRLFVTTAAQPPVALSDTLAGTLFEIPAPLLRGHKGVATASFAG